MKTLKIHLTFIIIFISLFIGGSVSAATNTWDFDNAGDYTASDIEKVEVSAGNGTLVNDPLPKGVGNISYAAMSTPATVHSTLARGIARSGDYFYISFCSSSSSDSSISVVEVSDLESPTSPTHINTGTKCTYDLHVEGNYLYTSNWQDNSVDIFDISTPANPVLINTVANDATRALASSQSVYVVGNTLYTSSPADQFGVIDITDPLNPVTQGLISDDATTALDYTYQIVVDGNYAYVTALADSGVEVLDITDPLNPTHVGAIFDDATTSLSSPFEIEKSGDYLYVAALGEDAIQVIDVSDPANPTHTATIIDDGTRLLDEPYDITIVGSDLYVVSRTEDAVSRIDISDPTNPQYVGALQNSADLLLNDLRLIKGEGEVLYTFGRNDGFQILTTKPYHQDQPYLMPTSSIVFIDVINTFTETLGASNQGTISYQVSTDDGVTWHYWNGSAWVVTTQTDGTETSSASDIDDNIVTLDTDGGNFLWRAYFVSDGDQVVELDQIDIIFDDITTPVTPDVVDLQSSSDTGILNTDNITSDNTPTFDIECTEVDSIITLYSDNPADNTIIGTHNCTSIGATSIMITPALADGVHNITATETDVAGNESSHSPALELTIDTSIDPTTINTPTTGAPVTGTAELGSTVTVTTDSGATCITTADPLTGMYSCNLSPDPIDGEDITATAVDEAGNNSSVTETGGIDTDAPTSPTVDTVQAGDTTITGTGEDGTTITLDIGTCTNAPVIVVGGVWSCDIDASDAPSKGDRITATSTDAAGNYSTGSYKIPKPSSGGGASYVCKDPDALNYSKFGRHKQSKCKYEQVSVSEEEQEVTAENPFGGNLCPSHLIIHDNMKNGDTNGQYSNYNKGVVTEISILQAHINRLLIEEYGPQAAGPVDDYFRGLTHRGVERLQKRLNILLEGKIEPLDIDGIVGPFTRAAINQSC